MTPHATQDDLLAYVLGDISAEEAWRIRNHTSECTECRGELNATSEALGVFGMSEATSPPAHLRKQILSKIRSPRVEPIRPPRRTGLFWAPLFASITLAATSLWLWDQNAGLRREIEETNMHLAAPADQSAAIRAALAAPDAQQFSLLPINAAPIPQGKAIYGTRQGSLIFIGSHFTNVPAGKAYELWLLPASGAPPVPAGVFRPDPAGNVSVVISHLASSLEAKGFAITMENESGSETPTMPILLIGTRAQA